MKNKNMSLLKMSNLTESLSRKYRLDESYSTNGITLDKMKSDIQKAKNRLKKKKSHENFGQNEVRKIADKYSSLQLDYYSDYNKLMNDFIDWCATVELNEDYGEDKYSLVGQDGNAFALMGYTSRCMKECGLRDEVDEMIDRATESNYDNLIMVCDEYIQRCNDIARDGFEESLSLTEKKWTYQLKNGVKLRKAIHDENHKEVMQAIYDCYEELVDNDLIDEEDFENYTQDFEEYLYDDISNWDIDDEVVNYELNDLYDLCDNIGVWISLNESLNAKKL